MKGILLIAALLAFCLGCTTGCAQSGTQVHGVFIASTPCNKDVKPLAVIPADADCEFMKWKLVLFQDAAGSPTTFQLNCTYGMTQPNTTGFKDGSPVELKGNWSIIKGDAAEPGAIMYQLNFDKPAQPLYFLKLNNDLLHLLDNDKKLMIGNPGWSFTLNRDRTAKL
jgi:hypothetical protein